MSMIPLKAFTFYVAPRPAAGEKSKDCTVHRDRYWKVKLGLICQDGIGSVLILLASCQQACMTYTIAVSTVKNT